MQFIHGEEDTLLSIGKAAKVAQISASTLRRYEDLGLITPLRTPGNQRRYRAGDVKKLIGPAETVSEQRTPKAKERSAN